MSGEREPHMRLITATLVDLAIRGFLRIEEIAPGILTTRTSRPSPEAGSTETA